ncbi:hypothetical protein Y1Q_0023309 [Alligator mississippiensis]|uniref:Uncharacterized protein n=1 Tax=Alligator mississippiensis TaxID=8496 RepID=A0A151NP59_ALLMI|nr:hypothetical protein Y1Q_0023309 [Alligator mississippiensis]
MSSHSSFPGASILIRETLRALDSETPGAGSSHCEQGKILLGCQTYGPWVKTSPQSWVIWPSALMGDLPLVAAKHLGKNCSTRAPGIPREEAQHPDLFLQGQLWPQDTRPSSAGSQTDKSEYHMHWV